MGGERREREGKEREGMGRDMKRKARGREGRGENAFPHLFNPTLTTAKNIRYYQRVCVICSCVRKFRNHDLHLYFHL